MTRSPRADVAHAHGRGARLFGVPALAGGLAFDAVPFVSAAGWCLFAATLLDSMNVARILRHAFVTQKRHAHPTFSA